MPAPSSDWRWPRPAAPSPRPLRAAIYRVTDPSGAVIHAGKDEFARGLALLRTASRFAMRASSARFRSTRFGDISGPFRLWRITNGAVTTIGEMSAGDVERTQSEDWRMTQPERYTLADDLDISRIVTGLWQVADMERGGTLLDPQVKHPRRCWNMRAPASIASTWRTITAAPK
jgi:hypothetical protein